MLGTLNQRVLCGDAAEVLRRLPAASIDCCVTSPPYWRKRCYAAGGIGEERTPDEYVSSLAAVFEEVRRVLKRTGSLWINLQDSYHRKSMLGLPWRLALVLVSCGWKVRNDVIWRKTPGPDNARDRLTFSHEHFFHLTLLETGYHYDDGAVRPGKSSVEMDVEAAAARVRRKIEGSELSGPERQRAEKELRRLVGDGVGFIFVVRGQRGNWTQRKRELDQNGFFFLRYDPRGGKMGDVWDICSRAGPEGRGPDDHGAAFPEELVKIPILATCPRGGVVLDPFCGTGTVLAVAKEHGRSSVGIDLSPDYVASSKERLRMPG